MAARILLRPLESDLCYQPDRQVHRFVTTGGGLLDLGPARIRVVLGHLRDDGVGLVAEVLLVDDALLVDDEGHHAGHRPLRRPGDEREAGYHVAIDDVLVVTAWRVRALPP